VGHTQSNVGLAKCFNLLYEAEDIRQRFKEPCEDSEKHGKSQQDMGNARCCFYLSFIAVIMILSALSTGLPVGDALSPDGENSLHGALPSDGTGLFIGSDDVLSNRDIIFSDSSIIDDELFFCIESTECLSSQIGSKLPHETSAVFRNAPVYALKAYTTQYIVSVSEGGKNVKNIPSNIKNWQYAVDPVHLEEIA
jgi:hypothetical protein